MTNISGDNDVDQIRAGSFELNGILKIGRLIPYRGRDGCFADGNNRQMFL